MDAESSSSIVTEVCSPAEADPDIRPIRESKTTPKRIIKKQIMNKENIPRDTQVKLKVNQKLIEMLEQEEQRLLENEKRYAMEIVELQSQLEKVLLDNQKLNEQNNLLKTKV